VRTEEKEEVSAFDKNERMTDEAHCFSIEISEAITPILEKYKGKGMTAREMALLVAMDSHDWALEQIIGLGKPADVGSACHNCKHSHGTSHCHSEEQCVDYDLYEKKVGR
jgi:hypothetical protein